MAKNHGVWKPQNSPFYYCSFVVGGRRWSGSTKTSNRADAIAFARRWKAAESIKLNRIGRAAYGRDIRFIDACDRFMKQRGQYHKRAQEWDTTLDWLVDRIGADTLLSAIDDEVVADLCCQRQEMFRFGLAKCGKVTPGTVTHSVVLPLQAIMNRAVKKWKIPLPDMPDWSEHKVASPPRRRELSIEEELAIEPVAGWLWPFIQFVLITGLRRADALIRWENIDWDAGVIKLKIKGDRDHQVLLTAELRDLLTAIKDKPHHPEFVFAYAYTCKYIGTFRPLSYYGVATAFDVVLRKAGIKDLTLHDLRRTSGARMYRATGDIGAVSRFLGHTTIALTQKHYVHITPDDVAVRMLATEYAVRAMRDRAIKRRSLH